MRSALRRLARLAPRIFNPSCARIRSNERKESRKGSQDASLNPNPPVTLRRRPTFDTDRVARIALLLIGVLLAIRGLIDSGVVSLATTTLGIAAIVLSAILSRVAHLRLFGRHGLDATLRPCRSGANDLQGDVRHDDPA
jgi:hypothetical protein